MENILAGFGWWEERNVACGEGGSTEQDSKESVVASAMYLCNTAVQISTRELPLLIVLVSFFFLAKQFLCPSLLDSAWSLNRTDRSYFLTKVGERFLHFATLRHCFAKKGRVTALSTVVLSKTSYSTPALFSVSGVTSYICIYTLLSEKSKEKEYITWTLVGASGGKWKVYPPGGSCGKAERNNYSQLRAGCNASRNRGRRRV